MNAAKTERYAAAGRVTVSTPTEITSASHLRVRPNTTSEPLSRECKGYFLSCSDDRGVSFTTIDTQGNELLDV